MSVIKSVQSKLVLFAGLFHLLNAGFFPGKKKRKEENVEIFILKMLRNYLQERENVQV